MTNKERDILMNAPVLFGLKPQGHLSTIERMLEDGATWEEIGKEIGWCSETVKEHYGWYIEYKKEHLKANLHFVEGEGWCI